MRRLLALAIIACGADGCSRRQPAQASSLDSLTATRDTAAIYNAGVAAYQAKRYDEARLYWQRSTEFGDREALGNLGYLVYYGLGGPADSLRGIALWRQSAALGHPEAHEHLAQAILNGDHSIGQATDAYAHAVAAKKLATLHGNDPGVGPNASITLAKLSLSLTLAERMHADSVGLAWAAAEVK